MNQSRKAVEYQGNALDALNRIDWYAAHIGTKINCVIECGGEGQLPEITLDFLRGIHCEVEELVYFIDKYKEEIKKRRLI